MQDAWTRIDANNHDMNQKLVPLETDVARLKESAGKLEKDVGAIRKKDKLEE
jgi:hypothetical protein